MFLEMDVTLYLGFTHVAFLTETVMFSELSIQENHCQLRENVLNNTVIVYYYLWASVTRKFHSNAVRAKINFGDVPYSTVIWVLQHLLHYQDVEESRGSRPLTKVKISLPRCISKLSCNVSIATSGQYVLMGMRKGSVIHSQTKARESK